MSLFRGVFPSFQDTVGAVSAPQNGTLLTGSTQPALDQLEGNVSLLLDYIYNLLPKLHHLHFVPFEDITSVRSLHTNGQAFLELQGRKLGTNP